jgi:D-3-phosphoglycerate dehydrogenase
VAHRVVVTDHAFADVEHERRVAAQHGAEFAQAAATTVDEVIEVARGARVVFVNFAPIDRAVLASLEPGATVIRYGVGYDNVDLEGARELGINVANVPDYGIETVADHAAASLLALGRRLSRYDHAIRTDGWVTPAGLGAVRSFRNSTVGIVGFGKIAQAVAARLAPFGFTLLCYDPYADAERLAATSTESVSLDELAERSHAISLHAPSTPETHRMIDAHFLARLPHGAVLVNTARGSLVDEHALYDALARGQLAGAALDVTDPEPVPADSPLRTLPSVVFTPHAAFYDEDSLDNLQRLASEEAHRALAGLPLRCRVA